MSSAALEGKDRRTSDRSPLPKFTLRCYVYKRRDQWVAVCIDLDLIVKADTPDVAARSLYEALAGYLKTVEEGDPEGLIPRPSPLSHRLRYHWFCLKAAFATRRRNFRLIDYPTNQMPQCT